MIHPNDSWNERGSGWGRKSARKRERDIPYSTEVRRITYNTFDVTDSYLTWSHSFIRDVSQFYMPYSTRGLLNHDSFGHTILKTDSWNYIQVLWCDSFMCDMVSLMYTWRDSILHTTILEERAVKSWLIGIYHTQDRFLKLHMTPVTWLVHVWHGLTHSYVTWLDSTYSQLQIGWHRIFRFFLKTFHIVPGVPGFLWDQSLVPSY